MWEQQSSIRIWAGTRLHPDLGAARLGQDLHGPARILMLDCLFSAEITSISQDFRQTSGVGHNLLWQ